MKVVKGYPPNFAKIRAAFPVATAPTVLFCYGDTIYAPGGTGISDSLKAHEEVHSHQQQEVGGPDIWWDYYIASPEFRFRQELEAHRAEYQHACHDAPRRQRRVVLSQIASRLASKLYGGIVSKEKAKMLIAEAL